MDFKGIELRWAFVFVLGTSFMSAEHANAVDTNDLVGEWTVSVDLSDASQLARLEITNVPVAGSQTCVVDRTALRVFDISDPINPQRRGFFRTKGRANKVDVCGRLALVEVDGADSNRVAMLRYARE